MVDDNIGIGGGTAIDKELELIDRSGSATGASGNDLCVTLKWSILFNLNWEAATKTFSSLRTELLLKVLCESTWTMSVRVIHGVRGRGRYPRRTRWFKGRSEDSAQ